MKVIILFTLLFSFNLYSQDSLSVKPSASVELDEQGNIKPKKKRIPANINTKKEYKPANPKTRTGIRLTAEQEDSLKQFWAEEKERTSLKLGFTKEQVLERWGKPKEINRTVGSWGGA